MSFSFGGQNWSLLSGIESPLLWPEWTLINSYCTEYEASKVLPRLEAAGPVRAAAGLEIWCHQSQSYGTKR